MYVKTGKYKQNKATVAFPTGIYFDVNEQGETQG